MGAGGFEDLTHFVDGDGEEERFGIGWMLEAVAHAEGDGVGIFEGGGEANTKEIC